MGGSASPRLLVLGGVRKQAEQGMRSKPINRIQAWLLFQFLPRVPTLPSLSEVVWPRSGKLK